MAAVPPDAVDLVATILALKGNDRIIPEMVRDGRASGMARAVRRHDTAAIYDWLMGLLSLQGISDQIAFGYIEKWGNATYADVARRLASTRCACPKLLDFASYTGCGYRKGKGTCANPQHLRLCPVRQLPLRKGLLNIQAVSLYHWLADVCGGDLVARIDATLAAAKTQDAELTRPIGEGRQLEPLPQAKEAVDAPLVDAPGVPDATAVSGPAHGGPCDAGLSDDPTRDVSADLTGHKTTRDNVDEPPPSTGPRLQAEPLGVPAWAWQAKEKLAASFSAVEGVSAKLANMTLAALMIGGRPKDPGWVTVATQMVTVDSLIHNMLERTGILAAFGAEHAYGPQCYGPNGCEAVIYMITEAIRAKETAPGPDAEPSEPKASSPPSQLTPIEVQKALWRFCTAGALDVCNAARVGQGPGCQASDCPVWALCRHAQGSAPPLEPEGAQG